ncbi:lipopolysaccharide biosynthesis protein, partial [Parabacteroides sp.]
MLEENLKNKTIKGVGWSVIDTVARYGIIFIVGVILARLLSPNEYGLIGILTIFINVFNVIVDGGFINAIIRKQNANDVDFCTVFYTNMAISSFLSMTLFFSADLIASFFERPELICLTRVMSVIIIINGLSLVQKAKLTKVIDFKTQTKISVISSIFSGFIGVLMALKGYGVWALVGQQISNQMFNTILLWIYNRWIPKFTFSFQSFKELWDFGWKLLVSGILDSVWRELYQVVIGKCYSPATLGYYTRASQFSSLCSSNITTVVQRVSFPVFCSVQSDTVRLKSGYKRVIKVTMLSTCALTFGLAACSESLIYVLLGSKWMECVPMLQILCLYMFLDPLHSLNLNAIQIIGRSDLTLKLKIIKTILSAIPLAIGVFIGIY